MPFDETRFAVFSAHAEVVPTRPPAHDPARRILRARGGSSQIVDVAKLSLAVFSAHAEVVPYTPPNK